MIKLLPALITAAGLAVAGYASAQPFNSDYGPDAYQPSNDIVVTAPPWRPDAEVRSVGVRVDDLNLATHAGAFTLLNRIRSAASRVCNPTPTSHDGFNDVSDYQRCFRRAVYDAVAEVDAPTLQDVYYETDPYPPGGR